MSRQRPFAASRGGGIAIAIGLTVLTVAVAALSITALRQGRGPGDVDATAGPVPTFTYAHHTPAAPTASPVRTVSPSPTASADTSPGPAERFLSVGADAMWRGTAGVCGAAAPLIERSSDGGSTWQTVTPTTKGITQLFSLTSFGGRNATAVVELGSSCAKNTLRTYTDGQFWEPYPDIFALDTYALPGERAVMVEGKRIATPCRMPWGLRSAGGVTALVCEGTAYRLDGQTWAALSPGARAVAVTSTGVYVAHTDAACAGIRITAHPTSAAAADLGCTTLDASDAEVVALDATGGTSGTSGSAGTGLALWVGNRIIDIAG